MVLDNTLTYSYIVENIEILKELYINLLVSLSFFKVKELKDKIYALNFAEWKKDKIWEYLNNDIEYDLLCKFV